MKKLIILFLFLSLIIVNNGNTEKITLNTGETIGAPETGISMDWYIDYIDAENNILKVNYQWRDALGKIIRDTSARTGWNTWTCQDIPVENNIDCIGAGDPYGCCTGVGTGTCDEVGDTCFSNIFRFEIRAQDVGTKIGVGLRSLIWNQMKTDVLTGVNDGVFGTE